MTDSNAIAEVAGNSLSDESKLFRNIVRGGSLLFVARLAVQLLTWSVTIVVARYLMPYDYGVLTAGGILMGLSDMLAEMGVGKALVQKAQLEPDDLAQCFTLSLLMALVLYGVLYLIAGPAADFFRNAELVNYLRIAGLTLLIVPFRSVPIAIVERHMRLVPQAIIHTTTSIVQSAVVLSLAVAGRGFWSLVVGTMVGKSLEVVMLAAYSGWRPRLRSPRRVHGSLLSFGLHVSSGSLLWYFYSNADFTIVSRLRGPTELGYYAFAFGLISFPVQKLMSSINVIAYPIYCRFQSDPARIRAWYLRLVTMFGILGVPALLGLALVANDMVVVVLGPKWAPAVLPIQLLSIVGVFMTFGVSLMPVLLSFGRADVNLRYSFVCAIVYPSAFYSAGWCYGIIGVCLVWVIVYPLMLGLLVSLTCKITGISIFDYARTLSPVIKAAACMVVAVLLLQGGLGANVPPSLRLVLAIASGVTTYVGALWILGRSLLLDDVRRLWQELRG